MRIFCTRIIREKTYRELLRYKTGFNAILKKEILKKKLPVVLDKTLENKKIILSRGLILVNSNIIDSHIDYKSREAIKAEFNNIIQGCVFTKKKK